MNPLVRHYLNDGYPAVSWMQDNTTIGSFGRDTRFRIGVSGGVFVCENTAPPYDTQIDLFSQTALSPTPEFAGTDAEIADAIAANYEWRVTSIHAMTVSGVAASAWNAISGSGLTTVTFLLDDPIADLPSYRVQVRDKATLTTVANFLYNLDGF